MDLTKEAINNRFIESITNILEIKPELSKKELAASLGIKPSKFSEILGGRMSVGLEELAKYSVLYNIDINWLMTGRKIVSDYKNSEIRNYINEPQVNYQNQMFNLVESENTLLREQLDILNCVVTSQKDTIEAFKRGDIIIARKL